MSKQWGIDFQEFDFYCKKIESISNKNELKKIADKALKETHKQITPKIEKAFSKHVRTGKTSSTLKKDSETNWNGDIGTIDVGYAIHDGGLASIFIMYGTPRIKPDKNLYNVFYGSKIKNEMFKIQENIFNEELQKLLNK